MKVSVIIVNYNVKYFIEVCLHSVIRALKDIDGEIIVVDNNSSDGSCEMIQQQFSSVRLVANKENAGFSRANNQAVLLAKGEYILFLNPDTVMPEDFFTKGLQYMDTHPKAGALGPKQLDGKGAFAIGSKKSFPTFWVAIFKTTGLNKLFPKSAFFNRYFAVHIGENETAPIEVLHGCCMLVRRKAMEEAGGAFDEDYFMYCEDVDLSYRIIKAGYENIYYPEILLIHYKGESTRKASLKYIRIFNNALATFVRKHYSASHASIFIFLIKIGIIFRAGFALLKNTMKLLKAPILDALVLITTLWVVKEVWMGQIRDITPTWRMVLVTFPIYTLTWIISLFLNGAYDNPYKPTRVVRGMIIGTILALAVLGLLNAEFRYSRAVIVFSGFVGTVLLIGIHSILYRTGILKKVTDGIPHKAVIVADTISYLETTETLRHVPMPPEVIGRIDYNENAEDALDTLNNLKNVLYATDAQEVIFCVNDISYERILHEMMLCGKQYEYKIHLPGSRSFVGSNSETTSGDLYTIDSKYVLSSFAQQRNKRVLDIALSICFICLYPILIFIVKKPLHFLTNCFKVLFGRRTWIGYAGSTTYNLPKLNKGVIPLYHMQKGYEPTAHIRAELNQRYALHYTAATDLNLILKNFRYLGE